MLAAPYYTNQPDQLASAISHPRFPHCEPVRSGNKRRLIFRTQESYFAKDAPFIARQIVFWPKTRRPQHY